MKNEKLKHEILQELSQFSGSEKLWEHRTPFGRMLLTDGCNYLRDKAQCRWLFDLIFSYQEKLTQQHFQCWTLKRVSGNSFLVVCEDGNKHELIRQDIPFSDFVLEEVRIWMVDEICLLPSEY